jgi:hypothetical protein
MEGLGDSGDTPHDHSDILHLLGGQLLREVFGNAVILE